MTARPHLTDPLSDGEFRRAVGVADDLLRKRAFIEAESACAVVTDGAPDRIEGWLLTARLHQRRGDFPGMKGAADRALTIKPAHTVARFIHVEALFQCGHVAAARAELAAIETGAGDDPEVLARLVLALTHAGQYADVDRCASRALELRPDDQEMRHARATTAIALGRLGEAELMFDSLIADNPRFFDAYYNRATVRRWTAGVNHIAAVRRVLAGAERDPDAATPLHYALGKELEDTGDHAGAFRHIAAGAAARRSRLSYDVATDVNTIDAIIAAFDEGYCARNVEGHEAARPIFIVGLPRSGTTLVERILAKHPQVDSVGEVQDLALAVMRAGGPAADKRSLIANTAAADPASIGREYWEAVCGYGPNAEPGKAPGVDHAIIDKTPLNFLYLGLIAKALPQARIVHVRRHPMASGYAMFKTLFRMGYPFSYDLDDIGRYYEAYRRLMDHWDAVLPGRVLTIDYEDLVDDQESISREIVSHCGLTWDDACLAFHENAEPTATASAAQVRQPMYRHARDLWRTYETELAPLARVLTSAGLATS